MTLLKKIASLGGATALLIASATAAQATTYTKITGTWGEIGDILQQQTWWGDSAAALAAAAEAKAQGIFGQDPGSQLTPGLVASELLEAFAAYNYQRGEDSNELSKLFLSYGSNEKSNWEIGPRDKENVRFTSIVAEDKPAAVPEPASLLGLVAVGGVGALMRRNLASSNEA